MSGKGILVHVLPIKACASEEITQKYLFYDFSK
jgi:hypothetical protein